VIRSVFTQPTAISYLPSAIGQKSDDLMISMISMSRPCGATVLLFCSLHLKKSIDRLLTGR
jgi:hypothetical protein